MFESLTEKIEKVIKNIKGEGRITENNINNIVRDVRLALLESDVNYKVVKEFTEKVKEKALGEEVKRSLKPAEMFLKILKDELLEILGNENDNLILNKKPSIIMLVGLQGSGKTTTVAKLGNLLKKKENKKVMFIAADIYRPAAIDQLKTLGKEVDIYVYSENNNPVLIVENGIRYAKDNNYDVIIIDTAGRLHIDDILMKELNDIVNISNPNEILLVIDAMIGQDAINVINGFNEKLKLTGTILTKMDSNTKGGVALSVKHLTNIPIKFVGNSEKIDGITLFDKERMIDRILGGGDILSIIEKAEEVIDKEEAEKVAKKLQKGDMNLNDFLSQLKQIKKMGPLENIIKMLPGASKMGLNNVSIDPKQINKIEAIISSMTINERENPDIIKASRKIRIANGSGTKVEDVNKLLNQFEQMKKMFKMFKNGGLKLPF